MPRPPPSSELVRQRAHLGRCLAMARKRANIEQDAAAAHAGVKRQTLSAWERGLGEPTAIDLGKLADLYGLTLDQLVGRDDLPPPSPED
jgi:transcriptional regulator with XRE-family HTH domain